MKERITTGKRIAISGNKTLLIAKRLSKKSELHTNNVTKAKDEATNAVLK